MDSLFSDKPRWNTSLKKRLAQVCKHDNTCLPRPWYSAVLLPFFLRDLNMGNFWCYLSCIIIVQAFLGDAKFTLSPFRSCSSLQPPGQHSNSHDLCSLPVMVGTAQTWCQNTMAHLQIDDHSLTYLRRFPKSWGYPPNHTNRTIF